MSATPEQIQDILADLLGRRPAPLDKHPITTIEKMVKEGREGSVCVGSRKLGRCYWEYESVILGDAEMPMTNGGRAYPSKDVMTDIGRLRLTTYRIDSGD